MIQTFEELLTDKAFIIIISALFVVRMVQLSLIYTISGDGPVYIEIAKHFFAGDIKAGLAKDYPPLYPMFISAAYSVIRDWIIAGRFVSFTFSVLTIFPLYLMAKEIFGKKIATLSSIFFIIQPVIGMHSSRLISESTYIFFFVLTVWLSWKAVSMQKPFLCLIAGIISGLAYLVRPEGLGVAIIASLFILFQNPINFKKTFKLRLTLIFALALGTLILTTPYILFLKYETGEWRLSKKKSIVTAVTGKPDNNTISLQGMEVIKKNPQARIPSYSRLERGYFVTLGSTALVLAKTYNPLLFLLLFLGLIRRKAVPRNKKYELYVGVCLVFYILILSLFYVSERHLMPLFTLCLIWSSIGFCELYLWIIARMPIAKKTIAGIEKNRLLAIALGLIVISILPWALRPTDKDKLGQKKVGQWIKENCKPSPYILTDLNQVVFYADGNPIALQNRSNINNYEKFIEFIKNGCKKQRGHEVDYLVIDKLRIKKYCSDFLDSVDSSVLKVIHFQPKLNDSTYGDLIVYEVR